MTGSIACAIKLCSPDNAKEPEQRAGACIACDRGVTATCCTACTFRLRRLTAWSGGLSLDRRSDLLGQCRRQRALSAGILCIASGRAGCGRNLRADARLRGGLEARIGLLSCARRRLQRLRRLRELRDARV